MKLYSAIRNLEYLENPVGKTSSDECKCLVEPFLQQFFGGYHEPFICITVCGDGSSKAAGAYGFQFELVPEITKDIRIVCAGDFQNVVHAAYLALLRGEKTDEYRNRFMLVPEDASDAQREKILESALELAATKDVGEDGKPKNRALYVEARIYRPHKEGDFVDLEQGKPEAIALLAVPDEDDDEAELPRPDTGSDPNLDSMSDEEFFKQ